MVALQIYCSQRNYHPATLLARAFKVQIEPPCANQCVLNTLAVGFLRPDDDDRMSELIETACAQHEMFLLVVPFGRSADTQSRGATFRHAPLFSEFISQTPSIKYSRIIEWPYGDAAIPWLADEDLINACREWLDAPKRETQNLVGPESIDRYKITEALSTAISETSTPVVFAERKFSTFERDSDVVLSQAEFIESLVNVQLTAGEAEIAFNRANENGPITRESFIRGLEKILTEALGGIESNIQSVSLSTDAALRFFIQRCGDLDSAQRLSDSFHCVMERATVCQTRFVDWARGHATDWIPVQVLPNYGIFSGFTTTVDEKPAILSRLRTIAGEEARLVRTHDLKFIRMAWDEAPGETIKFKAEGIERTLVLRNGFIVRFEIRGIWRGLPRLVQFFALREKIPRWLVVLFRETGELQIDSGTFRAPSDIICNCTRKSCADISAYMRDGVMELAALVKETGAGSVCGGCRPLLEEFLGSAELDIAELILKNYLGNGIFQLRLRPVVAKQYPIEPGQHILVQVRPRERWITRAYTVSAFDVEAGVYEISIKREEMGEVSRWLADEANNESLFRISAPRGNFVSKRHNDKGIVFFAGGIGITPALAMMRSLDKSGETRSFRLLWCAPHTRNFVFHDELVSLTQRHPEWRIELRATRENGRPTTDDFVNFAGEPGAAEVFVCGPSVFMDSVRDSLVDRGWITSNIEIEAFGSNLNAQGNLSQLPPVSVADGVRPIEQQSTLIQTIHSVAEEAEAFLRQCYAELGVPDVFPPRWVDVQRSIAVTGSYEHTYDELAFAVRVAWRNSNRCLGRDFWQRIDVRDMRHLETEEEMFAAVREHIVAATNHGELRPTITIFKQDGRRIWNPHFFRYAGYEQEDGKILGDSAQLALTKEALRLGWSPEGRTQFDYLPIIIQLPGRQPRWFSLPEDLILEVPIEHPNYPWFAEIGLKWYALPAVTNMALDAGGIQYTAAPFNGFYMGTEIGARNFGDATRYNLLPLVGAKMGLDTTNERSLWRDRAAIEMNIAVLHSYARKGVRMLDHHALTDSFMRFAESERACGRKVQVDRDYIVPPISGSLTATFHASFDGNRYFKPGLFFQLDAWEDSERVSMTGCPVN